jgi:hypothetical protein
MHRASAGAQYIAARSAARDWPLRSRRSLRFKDSASSEFCAPGLDCPYDQAEGRGGITGRTRCDGAAARRVRELRDRARHAACLAGASSEGAPHDRAVVLPRSVRPPLVYRGDADGRRAASAHGVADDHVVARGRGRPRRQPWRGSRAAPWRRERHDVRPRNCARRANAHRQHGTAEWRAALDSVARSRQARRALRFNM